MVRTSLMALVMGAVSSVAWPQSAPPRGEGRPVQQAQAGWIPKAREAEALLSQENGVALALDAYEKLEKEIPGQPAIVLRLAQLADQSDNTGLALFHYRRYLGISGARARQEAKDRAATLELNQAARTAADQLAKQKNLTARPVGTPAHRESSAIMAALGSGSDKLVEIKGREDLLGLRDPARRAAMESRAATPNPTASTGVDDLLVRSFAARSAQRNAANVPAARATPADGPRNFQGDSVTAQSPRIGLEEQPSTDGGLSPLPATQQDPTAEPFGMPHEGQAPQAHDASTQPGIPLGYESRQFAEGPARAPGLAQSSPPRPSQRTMVSDAPRSEGGPIEGVRPISRRSSPGPRVSSPDSTGEFTNVPPAPTELPAQARTTDPGTSLATPIDPRQRFFTSRASTDGKTRLRLANNLPESVLTFSALSESSSEKADAILATGENRTIDVSPAAFEIRMTIMSIGYPSNTLLDRRFRMRLNAGTEYSVRLTSDLMTRLN